MRYHKNCRHRLSKSPASMQILSEKNVLKSIASKRPQCREMQAPVTVQ